MIINNYYVEEINNVQKYKLPYELSLGLVIYCMTVYQRFIAISNILAKVMWRSSFLN